MAYLVPAVRELSNVILGIAGVCLEDWLGEQCPTERAIVSWWTNSRVIVQNHNGHGVVTEIA